MRNNEINTSDLINLTHCSLFLTVDSRPKIRSNLLQTIDIMTVNLIVLFPLGFTDKLQCPLYLQPHLQVEKGILLRQLSTQARSIGLKQ